MALYINTNVSAMQANYNLSQTSNAMSSSLEKLSTGLRINSAADDPAGLTISNTLQAQIKGLGQAIQNSNDGINMIQTAAGALTEVTNLIQSMRTLAVSASNTAVNDVASRQADQYQINSAISSLKNIAATTAFGNVKLLNGNFGYNTQITTPNDITSMGVAASATNVPYIGNISMQIKQQATQAYMTGAFSTGTYASGTGGTVTFSINTLDSAGNIINTQAITATIGSADTSAQALQDIANAINQFSGTTNVFAATSSAGYVDLGSVTYGSQFKFSVSPVTLSSGVSGLGGAVGTAGLTATAGQDLQVYVNIGSGAASAGDLLTAKYIAGNSSGTSGQFVLADTASTNKFNGFYANLAVTQSGSGTGISGTVAVASAASGELSATFATTANPNWTTAQGVLNTGTGVNVGVLAKNSATFQIGANAGQLVSMVINNLTPDALGFSAGLGESVSQINVQTLSGAQNAIQVLDAANTEISVIASSLGAFQTNTLQSNVNSLSIAQINLSASNAAIQDTNMAAEMTNFTRLQILMKSGIAMLSQANQIPSALLTLLQ
ncbi:flagellin domain protein [Thermodesulfobium narugense DSM 14796]|uniref:Flagellin n=1 Tax=Thermodesulfobium narugense DSM 14796 TaxID=747365 RepID=M1E487_9BACT|nr:flagellin [Thermodesulfobium narugense]AEE13817.1 flagellin domain protein [Thermodesulfobium narugense DSM 14796]